MVVGSIHQAAVEGGDSSALLECILAYESAICNLLLERRQPPCELWNNLGVVYVELDRISEAKTAFMSALEGICSYSFEWKSMAQSMDVACIQLRKDQLLAVGSNIAQLLTLSGASVTSRQMLQGLLRLVPWHARCRTLTAVIETTIGKLVEARMHWVVALSEWSMPRQMVPATEVSLISQLHDHAVNLVQILRICLHLLGSCLNCDASIAILCLCQSDKAFPCSTWSRTLKSMMFLRCKSLGDPVSHRNLRTHFMNLVREQSTLSASLAPAYVAVCLQREIIS